MRWSFRVATVTGIEVRIHVTFLLLLMWIGWTAYNTSGTVGAITDAILFVLMAFGVVILHEFGHALMARRFGINTQDITLLPIGGLARLERMPDNPRHELLVALAGPAVNVVLAAGLYALIAGRGEPIEAPMVAFAQGSLAARLFWVNVLLAAFNLLPAFPMDGGRALRAFLALRMESVRATQIAATLGQGMALLFGVAGLLIGDVFLMFVALFVWLGADSETKVAQMTYAMEGIPVEYAMMRDFRAVTPGDPISVPVDHVLEGFQHDFPVVEGDRVVGVLTRPDLMRTLAELGPEAPVSQAMRTDFQSAHPAEMLPKVFSRLESTDCQAIPVVREGGQLVGLINSENVGELLLVRAALRERHA